MFDPASPSEVSLVASASTFRSAIEEVEGEEQEADSDPDERGNAKAEADDANSVHGDLKERILMNSLR